MECEEGSAWHARARPLRSLNAIALTRTSSSVLAGTAECASGIRYWILLSLLEDRLKMCMLKSNQGLARLEPALPPPSFVLHLFCSSTPPPPASLLTLVPTARSSLDCLRILILHLLPHLHRGALEQAAWFPPCVGTRTQLVRTGHLSGQNRVSNVHSIPEPYEVFQ
eukprot:2808024-Rhodomonas_salina.3